MDSFQAMFMGMVNRNRPLMVFDWNKAAKMIKESNCKEAFAGLQGDWEYTGDCIFKDGLPITDREECYAYLASTWATPEIEIDGVVYECYIMQSDSPNWNSSTLWPESSLNILNEKE